MVFGARFDENWEVIHDYTETIEGLALFRGSKYVQSRIGEAYKQAKFFLKQGRKVLFTGTPCQIAGLKLFLRTDYENLLTVDFICHGVPSPEVWRKYLKELIARQGDGKNSDLSHTKPSFLNLVRDISRIEFRNKRLGWKKYSFALTLSVPDGHGAKNTVLLSEPYNKNIFMRGFLANLYLRPSCYACPAKCLKSGSDITIGDFWGIQNVLPEVDDDKGVSAVLVNAKRWVEYVDLLSFDRFALLYNEVCKENKALLFSAVSPEKRDEFYSFFRIQSSLQIVRKLTKISIVKKIFWRVINCLNRIYKR